jgi:phosphosulfolactate synthase (CoM biosynthesis protein A)
VIYQVSVRLLALRGLLDENGKYHEEICTESEHIRTAMFERANREQFAVYVFEHGSGVYLGDLS